MDTPDRPLDRSTASLNDPMPHTPAAAAMRDALDDRVAGADAVHPSPRAAGADDNPGDEIGEAVGGISGVLTGAALGSLGGPIGTVIGGIAGAVSGWWAGRAISESAYHATHADDEVYRGHHAGASAAGASAAGASADAGPAPRGYDDVRPAYLLGHVAGRNPDYHGRPFDEVEPDLRHGWTDDVGARHGSWDQVREYARHAYERSRATSTNAPGLGGAPATAAGGAASGTAATGSAAGTATGGTATQESPAAPASGSLDVGAASSGGR